LFNFKLVHQVDEKFMRAQQFSLVTQQPLRGSKQGGQRVGEMEVGL
jgi:DNA-directed RNA polymerase beta subunit